MATYVLVHGAWAGAWIWREVRSALQAAGHEVFTPSLSGQSERSHLGGPEVNLSTHVLDVQRLIQFEELSDVVLGGHSYGGMVITGVANEVPDLIRRLVYLDAFVPSDGDSVIKLAPNVPRVVEEGWKVMPRPRPAGQEEAPQPAVQRIFWHPLGTMEEPVRLSRPLEEFGFGLTYIKATEPPRGAEGSSEAFWAAYDHAEADPRWTALALPTTHNAQLTMPQELTRMLLDLA